MERSRGKVTIAIVLACVIGGLMPLGQPATSGADLALVAERAEEGVSRLSINASALPVATPVPGGRIAFVSDRDGNEEIYVMNADGSGLTNLTNHPADDIAPSWSPNGNLIAFESNRDGNWEIYVMKVNGTGVARLTNHPAGGHTGGWSPAGAQMAFVSDRYGEAIENVYVMEADGSSPGQMTPYDGAATWIGALSWSPVGDRLLYTVMFGVGYCYGVEIITATGAAVASIEECTGSGLRAASWSPEGTRVAVSLGPSYYFWTDICTVNRDGTGLLALTQADQSFGSGEHNLWPAWSPDGGRIAFSSDRYHFVRENTQRVGFDILVMNADGSGQEKLTSGRSRDSSPTWSPDGTRIAFLSDRDGNDEIYIMNADGGGLTNLTSSPARDWDPVWSPNARGAVWAHAVSLLSEKQALIATLSSPTFDFLGIPMPSAGYDELASSELLTRLEESQGTGLLSVSEASALQRLVLTEEALSDLYPSYALAADDTADGALRLMLIGLGFVRAFREVDKNLADTPFSPIAHELSIRITAKIVDLLNKAFEGAEYTISDPGEREAFRMMRETIWRAVQLRIMEAQDPFVDRGMTFLNAFSDVTLKPVAMKILLDRYVGQTQPIIDRAAHTADPEYTGLDKNEVQPTDERAGIQKEGVIDQVVIWSEYHHETYEHFKETADLPGVVGDLADIASMTGILAPIGQVVARVSDVMEGLLVGYGSVKSWQFLQCLESQAFDAETRIYDPSIAGGKYTGPCERAHRLGLFSLRGDEERGASVGTEAKARVQGELGEYGALVEKVLEAIEAGDDEELVVLIGRLLEEDEALAEGLEMLDVALAATDPEGSTELYSRGVEFQLQSVVFYASLIDVLTGSGDGGELREQATAEGEELLDALTTYEVGVEALPEAAETGEEAGTALLAIRRVSVPEMEVGEEASIEVQVTNLGSASSGEVSLQMAGGEHVHITEEKVTVGLLEGGEEGLVVFNGEGVAEGTEILMVEVYEGDRYVSGEMVLARVSEGREGAAAPGLAFEPWMPLLCGISGLIPLILGSGIGVWLWRKKASTGVQPCPHCGAENVMGNRYCIRCGEGLD